MSTRARTPPGALRTILHTIDTPGSGGAETVCAALARGLDSSRFRSRAAVVADGWLKQTLEAQGVETFTTPMGRGGFDFGFMYRLARVARRQNASLLQTHLLTTNLYGGLVGRLLRVPTVAAFHGMVDVTPDDRLSRVKLRLIAANVSRLVFVSRALQNHFHKLHALKNDRSVVIPNGIDPGLFRPEANDRLRRELGLDSTAVIVGAVGNVRPAKGYADLLRVAGRVCRDNEHVRFVIAGETTEPLYSSLRQLQDQLGLQNRVTFVGFRADIAEFLNGIDVYLSTSTSEGFSLTTIQAMACGRAVVATRSGGPDEIVTDGVDGLLVPVSDLSAIAAAIQSCVDDLMLRRRLGADGRDTVLRSFTLRRMIDRYEAAYDEVLSERGAWGRA